MTRMKRRAFITLLGGAAAALPLAAQAQQPILPIIGILSPLSATTAAQNIQAFRLGMRSLGYSEERDITFELRFADGAVARLPEPAEAASISSIRVNFSLGLPFGLPREISAVSSIDQF